MKLRIIALAGIAVLIVGCGAAPQQATQPFSGTARMEVGQNGSGQTTGSSTVQGMTPQLPPKGPDGGPL